MNGSRFLLPMLAILAACNPQAPVPPAQTEAGQPTADSQPAQQPEEKGYSVVNWSPQSTSVGTSFNVQADGNSGISFELNRPVPAGEITATFDGRPLSGVAASGVIVTATIPEDYLGTAGNYEVALQLPSVGQEIKAGEFEVK